MPGTKNGTWVEYDDHATERITRTFGSEVNALRSAVTNGNKVAFVEFGETLAEALHRQAPTIKPTAAAASTAAQR